MATGTNTYFTPESAGRLPFYILNGVMVDDRMCSDTLGITDIEMQLHRHLKRNGYDVVFFFCNKRMLYTYDLRSSFALQHARTCTREQLLSFAPGGAPADPGEADAPRESIGFMRFRRGRGQRRAAAGDMAFRNTLNYGTLSPQAAVNTLSDMLENTNVRSALVITNLNDVMLGYSYIAGAPMEQLTETLFQLKRNRVVNNNIVIFLSASNADIEATLGREADSAPILRRFAHDFILPVLHDRELGTDHFIQLPPPTLDEIRGALTIWRMRSEKPLRLQMRQFDEIARRLYVYCTKKAVSLDRLLTKLDGFCDGAVRPDAGNGVLTLENISLITGGADLRSAREQLDEMIGMEPLKRFVRELEAGAGGSRDQAGGTHVFADRFTPVSGAREKRDFSLNVALMGEPGTGKTRTANILAQVYYELGYLPSAKVVERTVSELTNIPNGEGVRNAVEEALGGVLFIDEAHSLMDDYVGGQTALNTLVACLERYKGRFALIIAGYEGGINSLLENNPTLPGKIENHIALEAYTPQEMLQIFRYMVRSDGAAQISGALEEKLEDFFAGWVSDRGPGWSNAREAEKLLKHMKDSCRLRKREANDASEALILTPDDIPEELQTWLQPRADRIEEVVRLLREEVIGLDNVKDFLINLQNGIEMGNIPREPGKYIFMGPPGTGKTMMAGKMAEILHKLGVIRRRTPVIYTAKQLLQPPQKGLKPGQLPNPNETSLRQAVNDAKGSILVIDEAHQLPDTQKGRDLLRDLVPIMDSEEFRTSTGLILCGYTSEMHKVIGADAGFESRFPVSTRVKFNNYTADELTRIMAGMAKKRGERLDEETDEKGNIINPRNDGFLTRSRAALSAYLSRPITNFENARFIRDTYLPDACRQRDRRLLSQYCPELNKGDALSAEMSGRIPAEEKRLLTGRDIPADFQRYLGPVDSVPLPERNARQLIEELYEKDEIKAFITRMTTDFDADTAVLNDTDSVMHYTICGPLGSGRRTAITAIANAFAEAGLIDSKEVHYFGKGDLEAGYVGQTAEQTRNQITGAQGGTVVINAPSSMLPYDHQGITFGPEALGEVFNCMDLFGKNTCFVFLDTEPGMEAFKKAFPRADTLSSFVLEDLSIGTMQRLLRGKMEHRFRFEPELADLQDDFVANLVNDRGGVGDNIDAWSNGAQLDKILEEIKTNWAGRADHETVKDAQNYPVMLVKRNMIPKRYAKYLRALSSVKGEALAELDGMIGLTGVKNRVRTIAERTAARMKRQDQEGGGELMPGLYLFLGNPGVGKTMVAKLMGRALAAAGALEHGYVIVRTARQMIQQTAGRPDRFKRLLRTARGNVLFIDEAHQLRSSGEGVDVVQQLLTSLEDIEVTRNTCIILAGYPQEMLRMLEVDQGLKSRFGKESSIIQFEDYTEDELVALMKYMAAHHEKYPEIEMILDVDLETAENRDFVEAARSVFGAILATHDRNFGNARFVRSFLADAAENQEVRLYRAHNQGEIPREEYLVFRPEDISARFRRFFGQQQRRRAIVSAGDLNTSKGEYVE